MSTRFEDDLRTLLQEATPALTPPADLPAIVAARGRRRRVGGALVVTGSLALVVALAVAVTGRPIGGLPDIRPGGAGVPGGTVQFGLISVQVPSGWAVSEQPPATWCDARPRTVYLGGTLPDPAQSGSGSGTSGCPDPVPGPVVWVGRAGVPMAAPLPLVRLPGGGLGRVELSGIGPSGAAAAGPTDGPTDGPTEGPRGIRRYLALAPAGDGSQLVATLADRTDATDQTGGDRLTGGGRLTAELDGLLQRIRVADRPLTRAPAPFREGLVTVTDNRPPGPERHSRTLGDETALAAITDLLGSLPGAVVDPADACFSTVTAADLTDPARVDRSWREFRSRWPGTVFLLGGHELLVGSERCRYVVDSDGGAAGWRPGLLDELMALAGGPDPAG